MFKVISGHFLGCCSSQHKRWRHLLVLSGQGQQAVGVAANAVDPSTKPWKDEPASPSFAAGGRKTSRASKRAEAADWWTKASASLDSAGCTIWNGRSSAFSTLSGGSETTSLFGLRSAKVTWKVRSVSKHSGTCQPVNQKYNNQDTFKFNDQMFTVAYALIQLIEYHFFRQHFHHLLRAYKSRAPSVIEFLNKME